MLRKQITALVFSVGVLCLAAPLHAASTLTSDDGLSVLTYDSGSAVTVYTNWAQTLIGGVLGESSGFSSNSSFNAGGAFGVSGATVAGVNYQGNTGFPIVITMPNLAAFTGVEFYLAGTTDVTLHLANGGTVTTGVLNFGGTPTFVVFDSPIQIVSAQIDSLNGGTLIEDVSWGTADPSQLPVQPNPGGSTDTGGGDSSPVPEGSSLWLMGGGLMGLSQLIRRRKFFLHF